ncbi:outer membrane lipoprotein carrier protein LolA [Streptomyces sp. NPDC102384]|uniref:LolA family protein n=1 Tax=unclassified Streptomyces TaxID=2593676 RepID=UPI0038012679
MAPYASEDSESGMRRKAVRYAVPVAVLGVAAATIGLVPALASSGDPDLPDITARQLIEKIAKSDTEQLSGTVKIQTDLGLPSLGGAAGGGLMGGGERGDGESSADPQSKLTELATGSHTLRVAADGADRQKLSILDDASEYSVIHNGDDVWAYDSKSDEAYHAKQKQGAHSDGSGDDAKKAPKGVPATPKELTDEILKAGGDTTSFSVDGTSQVAGRDAYRLQIKPKQSGSTVGAVTVSVDAKTGTPLKFSLTPAGGGAAVVDAGFTKVDFAKPAASTFDFKPSKGTKVTEADELAKAQRSEHGAMPKDLKADKLKAGGLDDVNVIGKGWTSIAELKLPKEASGLAAGKGSAEMPPDAQKFLNSLGDQVKGEFGSGTVYSTRLVNVLVTEDGKAYAGAVTKDALVKAANAG